MKLVKQSDTIATHLGWKREGDGWVSPYGTLMAHHPEYPLSLDAMAEAEKCLSKHELRQYGSLLQECMNLPIVGWTSSYEDQLEGLGRLVGAEAELKAECWLRAKKLWEE